MFSKFQSPLALTLEHIKKASGEANFTNYHGFNDRYFRGNLRSVKKQPSGSELYKSKRPCGEIIAFKNGQAFATGTIFPPGSAGRPDKAPPKSGAAPSATETPNKLPSAASPTATQTAAPLNQRRRSNPKAMHRASLNPFCFLNLFANLAQKNQSLFA